MFLQSMPYAMELQMQMERNGRSKDASGTIPAIPITNCILKLCIASLLIALPTGEHMDHATARCIVPSVTSSVTLESTV